MSAKLSIIIPAYNAERTVERTVRNVLAQTLRDIEVWVVDDGSADGTAAILDRLAAEDARVRVIHQENCGAYQARLAALRRIRTPYFGFVDADDTIESEMYERMLVTMERERLDAVQCELAGKCSENDGALRIVEGAALEDFKYRYLVDAVESCFIWDKVYRNQYDFASFEPTDRVTNFDDMIFNFQFFAKIRRMGFLRMGYYHYAETPGSAVHAFGPRQRHDFWWMVRNHWRLTRALFSSDKARPFSRLKLWIGHRKWFWRNLRSAIISMARSVMRKHG